jgi:serine/threonine-protein kinase
MSQWNLIVPAGQIGEVQGRKPVWTAADRIAYNGCNTWQGGGSCGIFTVGSWATKRTSNGENPVKVLDGASASPTDSKAGLVAFHSREPGNWEAFVMAENGAGVVNISNGPNSSDGLPTISPDAQWVAFVSDREGAWAIFVAPIGGGPAQKLFDFPKPNPWGVGGGRDWPEERISWGR